MPRLAVPILVAIESAKAKAARERIDVLVVRASKMGKYGIRERFYSTYCAGVTTTNDALLHWPIRDLVYLVSPDGTVTLAPIARGAAFRAAH